MSEYQYYEFQAIDRPLSDADRQALRNYSTRAQITATSFTNTYEWGDFKGDPAKFMERWFDLHLYLANWGSRRLMIRLPARMVDRAVLDGFLREVECASLQAAGDTLILDIARDELAIEDWEDGSGRLAGLAPLRADVLSGDLRLFYLLWLIAVEEEAFEADEPEPLPGIGPMTATLEAFADFFGIDPDLVEAAAERSAHAGMDRISAKAARAVVAAMPDGEKTGLLMQVFDGDPHVAAGLRAEVRKRLEADTKAPTVAPRTVGDLLARAEAIRLAHEQAEAEKAAAEKKRKAAEAEKIRRARLDAIARRGEAVWREIEAEIERRNAAGYKIAADLLADLKTLAAERGTNADFQKRLSSIRDRHARKGQFIKRLEAIK